MDIYSSDITKLAQINKALTALQDMVASEGLPFSLKASEYETIINKIKDLKELVSESKDALKQMQKDEA